MNPIIVAPIVLLFLFLGQLFMRKALDKDLAESNDFWQKHADDPEFQEVDMSELSYNRDPLG